MPTLRDLLPALLLFAAPSAAQVVVDDAGTVLDPETGLVLAAGELVVPAIDLEDGWLELTPLASERPPSLIELEDRGAAAGEKHLRPGVGSGAAMLCTGGRAYGVTCEEIYLEGLAWVEPGTALEVPVRFEPGLAVTGRLLLDGWPMARARVAAVPAGIKAPRAFTLPLGLDREVSPAGVVREVASDREGRFALPPLAADRYFLETVLPSGRVHRGEPFDLPAPSAVLEAGAGAAPAVWDLGEVDVADGLVIRFEVGDLEGRPLAAAWVAGRQGDTPDTLVSYQAWTDAAGEARMSGFAVDQPVHVGCGKEGYRTVRRDYPLLPVLVDCVLEPLAAVRGEVTGIDGAVPAGALVSLEPLAGGEAPEPAGVDVDGRFAVDAVAAGEYRLTAAAPGFEVETRTLVLEPGQRLELEAIVLAFGRELEGRVVDAETREPIAGVEIRAVSPPGAVRARTDRDGSFVLATRLDTELVLRLEAAEHARREVTLGGSRLREREPLELEMERAGWIRAVVWDEAAEAPCQGCRLLVRPSSSELVTDGLGEALSAPLLPGWYRVHRPRVTHLGSTVVEEEDAELRHVRVRREEVSTVRFGERRRVVRVVFGPAPGADWTLSARTSWRTERYQPLPDGGFGVRHRPGESLDLYLHRYDPTTGTEAEVRQATMPAAFEGAELVLPLAGALVRGRATSGGSPLAGVRVRLSALDADAWATVHTRPDGAFAVPHVPAGVYAVSIGERNVHFASLRPGQMLDLGTFDLIPGSF